MLSIWVRWTTKWSKCSKRRVTGMCPGTGVMVSTYAAMTPQELAHFQRTLVLFCPACRMAHVFSRDTLRLAEKESRL